MPGAGTTRDADEGPEGSSVHLSMTNDFAALCRAMEAVDAFLSGGRVDDEAAYTVRLAVEEVVTNVIKYAYADPGPREIGLDVWLAPERVTVRVTDDGREFDPCAAPAPDLDVPLEEKTVGGVGIHLVKAMAESLEYVRAAGRNVLTVMVRRKPVA
jgi:serine/threonine-protein kinase RsbW